MDRAELEKAGLAIVEGIPKEVRERYRRRAMLAPKSFNEAVKLKCLDCCGWYYKEAKACHIVACPLHAIRARVFGLDSAREAKPERPRAQSTISEKRLDVSHR